MQRGAKEKILVVDDEELIRWTLHEALGGWGYTPVEAGTVADTLTALEAERPVVVLLDIYLPDGSGLELLREIKRRHPHTAVIIITANVLVENSVAALRGGAYDFIGKPINLGELQITIRNAIEAQKLRREVHFSRNERVREFSFEQIVGESPAMLETINLARKVAQSDVSSVLLQGDSGTGKDLVAKAIHYASQRAAGPFVAINCAALPANLIESELFGYEKGAFTDARARKEGLFEQAEGGSLFLDEIGELDLSLQAKLLRVLEEGIFRRVGGLKDLSLDVRVIASSNRNLRAESEQGRFRLDLFYRLSVMQIDISPLRERGQDVLLLAKHFIDTLVSNKNRTIRGLTPEVADSFMRYAWPGNVRELRNVIERAVLLEDSDLITTAYLPPNISASAALVAPQTQADSSPTGGNWLRLQPEGLTLDEVETSLVRQAVAQCGGNQTQAAELLGISRDRVRTRLRKAQKLGHKSMADFRWKLPAETDGGGRQPPSEKRRGNNGFEPLAREPMARVQGDGPSPEAEAAGCMQAEEAARESRLQLAGIIATAMDAILVTDSEQRIVIFNDAAERMFRCSNAEAKGTLLERFIPERFRETHREHVRRFGHTGETLRRLGSLPELVALRADGEEFPVEASISQIDVAGKKLFTVILREITERKAAEEKLREQAILLDRAQEAILLRSLDGPILYWNQGAERLYGWRAPEAVGRLAKDLLFNEPAPQLDAAYRVTLEKGEWQGEFRQVTKTGDEIIVESRWTLILSKENQPQAILAINTDITEKRRLEAELLRAARLSLVGEMAAGLAHEIKNPLAGIQGAVDILIERRRPDDAERRTLELVRGEVERIDRTVRALLEKARPHTLKLAPASLTEVVHNAVLLARHQVAPISHTKQVNLRYEPTAEPLVLPLDAAQIEDAVLNLVNNAVEAIDEEGCVIVRVSRQNGRGDSASAFEEALISVADDGRGISETSLEYIFNPFYTASSGGTGLGLAAVRRIARAHGGWVDAQSSLGHGSTFTIHLPFTRATAD